MTRLTTLVAAFAVLTAACGSETDDASPDTTSPVAESTTSTAAPTTTAQATSSTTAAPTTAAPPLAAQLVGRWAHYDVVAYEDDDLKTLIISYGFNDFTLDGDTLIDQASFCFSEQRTDQPIQTMLSDAATQAIQPPPTEVTVDEIDGLVRLTRPASPTPVGIRLDDPFTESLPTDPSDPRIVDDDGDGQPGITVTITVTDDLQGELYIARREIFAYEARLTEPDRLDGTVTDDSEQLVIGASDPIFATSPANWRQHPDPTKSPVLLLRVDESWDCERLRAEREAIFPPTPEVDW
ncbi:MAG: hypothetical protein AAGE98_10030 [Actinomycetota bacterium]